MISSRPVLLVSSMGGVATTAVLDFLDAEALRPVNPPRGFQNPLKHPLRPPRLESIACAAFLVGNPFDSLLSLFRRGRAALHLVNSTGRFPPGFQFPEQDAWSETVERFGLRESPRPGIWVDGQGRYASEVGAIDWFHRRKVARAKEVAEAWALVDELAGPALHDLEAYLAGGDDLLRWGAQLDAWSDDETPYPRVLIRYETMWSHLEELLALLEVPRAARERFPRHRPRRSRWQELPERRLEQLLTLYGGLAARIEALPELVRIGEVA